MLRPTNVDGEHMGTDDLRRRIDALDDRIVALLDERATVAADLAKTKRDAKAPTYDPERERAVMERLAARAEHLPADAIRAVYREVMSACLAVQQPIQVAFLGPPGTFTHAAARELFGLAARYVEAATIEGVFDAVRKGDASYGVVPIENSTEGAVNHALDALAEGGVCIRREIVLDVAQCILSVAAGLSSIERVYSHPQALGQCRMWLAKNLSTAQLVQTPSTTAAVREAAADPHGAAIAARFASEIHGVPVLRERVQDHAENATRFVTIATEDGPPTGDDKTTLVFSVKDERGALRKVLAIFDDLGINLSRIESRPSQKKAWDYVFVVDLEGHAKDENVSRALAVLGEKCPMVRPLGSYPRWRPTAPRE
jgi:chorismate mutase/prephenate dehydratase